MVRVLGCLRAQDLKLIDADSHRNAFQCTLRRLVAFRSDEK